jgi:RNA polymerase sigma-70 factor (ECF subfamily)
MAESNEGDLSTEKGRKSDHSLVRRLRAGENDAATQLYLRYAGRLGALAWAKRGADLSSRLDPEDLVQSIFRTFFRHAAVGEYDVPDGEDLWRLFLVIALHKIRDAGSFHRAAKRDIRATKAGDVFDEAARGAETQDDQSLHELRMVIDDLMRELPQSQRTMVEMRIEGYKVEEIAEKVQRSKRSVERGLQEFREKLSQLINEEDVK